MIGRAQSDDAVAQDPADVFLRTHNLVTVFDLAYAFQDEGEIVTAIGCTGAMRLVEMWREARAVVTKHPSRAPNELTAFTRAASERQRVDAARRMFPVSAVPTSRRRRAPVPSQETEAVRRNRAAAKVVDFAIALGSKCGLAAAFAARDARHQQAWKDRQVSRFSLQHPGGLLAHIRFWTKWAAWCREEQDDPLEPSTDAIPTFLEKMIPQEDGRGRTAATAAWNHFCWVQKFLGIQLKLDMADRPPPFSVAVPFST